MAAATIAKTVQPNSASVTPLVLTWTAMADPDGGDITGFQQGDDVYVKNVDVAANRTLTVDAVSDPELGQQTGIAFAVPFGGAAYILPKLLTRKWVNKTTKKIHFSGPAGNAANIQIAWVQHS